MKISDKNNKGSQNKIYSIYLLLLMNYIYFIIL